MGEGNREEGQQQTRGGNGRQGGTAEEGKVIGSGPKGCTRLYSMTDTFTLEKYDGLHICVDVT